MVRALCAFGMNSIPETLARIPLRTARDEFFWRTTRPPWREDDPDPRWRAELLRRGWIDPSGCWTGPFNGDVFGWWPGRADAIARADSPRDVWRRLPRDDRWRMLQENPRAQEQRSSSEARMSRVAAALVVAPRALQDGAESAFDERQGRKALAFYRLRFFGDADAYPESCVRGSPTDNIPSGEKLLPCHTVSAPRRRVYRATRHPASPPAPPLPTPSPPTRPLPSSPPVQAAERPAVRPCASHRSRSAAVIPPQWKMHRLPAGPRGIMSPRRLFPNRMKSRMKQ